MKQKYVLELLSVCCMIMGITGCKKFVQIDPPDDRLVTASVFSNSNSATAAVTAIYTQMQGESYSMAQNCGLLSDELTNNSLDQGLTGFYQNAMSPIITPASLWNDAYSYIYQANAILGALQNSQITNMIKHQLMGEAKFVRAFWYFYLTNCYGDVPLVTNTDYTINSQLPRAARSSIYKQILADLSEAEFLLSVNFVDQTDTTGSADRIRPTKWAAAALMARVYLFTGDYESAEQKATELIENSSLFRIEPDLNNVFLANSVETIWQLAVPTPNTFNTVDGNAFILISIPNSNGTLNTCTISPTLLNSFEQGDLRRTNWIDSFTTSDPPIVSYFFPYKYKVYLSNDITEYTMMLRLSEQYLIRAEARTQLGKDTSDILADLNAIRVRAGLSVYAGSMDKPSLLAAILHERQVEFFTEWGNRWLDLIRTGSADAIMPAITQSKGGQWNTNGQLFPIPQAERQKDVHLSQNPGYN